MSKSTTYNVKNPTDFANLLLGALGAPDTKQNVQNIVAWENVEGGAGPEFGNPLNTASFNPLNTSMPEPGSSNFNGGNASGVQAYSSWQQGIDATVATLENSSPSYGYSNIMQSLDTNQPWLNFATTVQNSSWDQNHYHYKLTTDAPPSTAGATLPIAYATGGADAQQQANAANSPSTVNGSKKMQGMAGILQELNAMYNPNLSNGFSLNPVKDITNLTGNMRGTITMVFIRGTSAVLSIGLIVVGIVTMMHDSSSGGGSGSGNVLEFVNNAKVQSQRANLNQQRIQARHEYNTSVSARSAERNAAGLERTRIAEESKKQRQSEAHAARKATEESRNARSNRWADIQEEYATRPGKK